MAEGFERGYKGAGGRGINDMTGRENGEERGKGCNKGIM